jgi:hypothetical protein
MQVLSVAAIVGTFALICVLIWLVGRSLQRRGHDLTFIDPADPESLRGVPGNVDITPPVRPYPHRDSSLFHDSDANRSPRQKPGDSS